MNRSRRFLYALYKQYVKRACENLGVSADNKENNEADEDTTYPQDFGKAPTRWKAPPKKSAMPNNGIPNTENAQDFMAIFDSMGMGKYDKDKIITDGWEVKNG